MKWERARFRRSADDVFGVYLTPWRTPGADRTPPTTDASRARSSYASYPTKTQTHMTRAPTFVFPRRERVCLDRGAGDEPILSRHPPSPSSSPDTPPSSLSFARSHPRFFRNHRLSAHLASDASESTGSPACSVAGSELGRRVVDVPPTQRVANLRIEPKTQFREGGFPARPGWMRYASTVTARCPPEAVFAAKFAPPGSK